LPEGVWIRDHFLTLCVYLCAVEDLFFINQFVYHKNQL